MEVYSFATHTQSLSSKYSAANGLTLRGSENTNQQGINTFTHNALLCARDIAINNFSTLVLTDNKKVDEVYNLDELAAPEKRIISTYLAISITNDLDQDARYLYFSNERETYSSNFNEYTTQQMLPLTAIVNDAQRYFNVELINSQYARINYKYDNRDYYLAANTSNELLFVSSELYRPLNDLIFNFIDETTFFYVLDEGTNSLFLQKPLPNNVTRGVGLSAANGTYLQLLSATNASNFLSFNTFNFKIRSSILPVESKMNTSFVKYNVDNIDDLEIGSIKTNLTNNFIVASQYHTISANEISSRVLKLKNQHSIMSHMDECSYTDLQDGLPGTQLREYTTLVTGNEQEYGNENIIVNYTIYSNDYTAKPDSYSLFKTSSDLYPYTQININDTTLAADGAFGGNSPYTSDQLFMLKNNEQGADGQYLCTWLSGGTWVDRYYNNNKLSPLDAAKAVNAIYGTYESYVDALIQANDVTNDFFDKKSDFVFQPDKEYYYYRIGSNRIASQLQTYSNNLILSSLNWVDYVGQPIDTTEYICNGRSYATFDEYSSINETGQMTIAFWAGSRDWSRINAHEIVSGSIQAGFSIVTDPIITPIILIQSVSAIHQFNSNLEEISKTTLSGAKFITRSDALEPFQAINSLGCINEFQSDGSLYDKKDYNESIIYATRENQTIYKLHSDEITVTSFDTISETVSTFTVDASSKCILKVNNNLYGLPGTKVLPYTDNAALFLYNQNQIVYKNYVTGDQYIAFKTLSAADNVGFIHDFALDSQLNLYVLHNNYKITKFDDERSIVFTTSIQHLLSSTDATNVAIDICEEYVSGVKEKSIIVLSAPTTRRAIITKLSAESGSIINNVQTSIAYLSGATFNLTGAQNIYPRYANRGTAIDFIVRLPNYYNNLDSTTVRYSFDSSDFSSGSHHFAVRIDANQGFVTFFIDGVKKYSEYIGAAKYVHIPILLNNIGIGATMFTRGTTLAKYLKQPLNYIANNITINKPQLYNAALLDNDIKFIYMQNYGIESVNFHLPCGQRNNLDKVRQMFTWGNPGFKSSNIKVLIKRSGITTPDLQNAIKTQVLQEIRDVLPVNVNIIDIEFAEFD